MTNRLAQSKSLYLRKHAENPIDWWPWCDEALQTAKEDNKPIFLSIGYSSCHWCTVMEGEAFSNAEIAAYMNANFLPIKVDREERPDVDSIYMQALQMMTGQGGWPLNIVLTPGDRIPFYGGTYFPVEPRYGRPGFLQVLQALRTFYDREREKLASRKQAIAEALHQAATIPASGELGEDLLQQGLSTSLSILRSRDMGPNFPMIPYAETALRATRFARTTPPQDSLETCAQRGYDLVLGGIFDHVAGGFHRYTVDGTWTVPHFEKMLYDNGQIMEYLAHLWDAGIQDGAIQRAIASTVTWLKREMTNPQGYFWAAQDADNFTSSTALEPEEGDFYTWEYSTLESQLTPEELAELKQHFDISQTGNFEGKIVLQRTQKGSLSDTLETALSKLFTLRYGSDLNTLETFPPARNNQEAKTQTWPGRIPPVTDTKMILSWNSLILSGLAAAAKVWQRPDYLDLAIQGANFLLKNQWVNGRCHRLNYEGIPDILAQSEDYALLIKALLDIQQASLWCSSSGEIPNLQAKIIEIQAEFDDLLWSVELGGYYNSVKTDDLIIQERSYMDNATPAANGIAIANLVRLFLLTENLDYFDRAEQGLLAFSTILAKSPQACPSLFAALDWYRNCTLVRIVEDQLEQLRGFYLPTVMIQKVQSLPEGAIAFVCQGLSCKKPATSLEELHSQLRQCQTRS
ncbi:thioredoxin domain-containing protein [Roseofilum sp. BLCC_M154]|uniref:Thioredoxin domain-containing protein n=1 Tax=Roseofilum acuticapitatum BLCC-M154 TaxID=3022444 RepID=A0ABT7AWB5_9CYAN|nr:thioredoxin domain-containing protein [Roseofilum acuticapitatum]MDJ1171210.1 thioredoxin domain-containing protein [Roseofilum acuticapitatum BLCC-M154]